MLKNIYLWLMIEPFKQQQNDLKPNVVESQIKMKDKKIYLYLHD